MRISLKTLEMLTECGDRLEMETAENFKQDAIDGSFVYLICGDIVVSDVDLDQNFLAEAA